MSPAQVRQWVRREHLDDGVWTVYCILCGKHFKRTFRPADHDDPQRAASDYVGAHLDSESHVAAVEAYRRPPVNRELTAEEARLRAIFGKKPDDRTDEQKRRAAARGIAEAILWRR